ncbi:MAG TPA: RodZ domain-containing protein [Thermomicrobiales bacterium]|jgi:cytoskeletal protein RodZ
MSGFGSALRFARENKGVGLDEVERAIRIPRKYLRALEEEDFSALPVGVYSRGIVRNYAQYLHLDPDDAIEYFEEIRGSASGGFKVVPAVKPMEVPNHWAPNFALIAFVVVISAVLFAWLYSAFFAGRDTTLPTPTPGLPTPTTIDVSKAILALTPTVTAPPPPTATIGPPTATTPPPIPTMPPATQAAAVAVQQQAAVSQKPAPTQKPAANPPTPTPVPTRAPAVESHTVTIQALEDAWVMVTVDGVVAFNQEMAADEQQNFEGASIVIESGRATSIYLYVDGAEYGYMSEDAGQSAVTIP